MNNITDKLERALDDNQELQAELRDAKTYGDFYVVVNRDITKIINQLLVENEIYKNMLNRIITIAPLAKSSYIISEAQSVLKDSTSTP